jgi:hypothetical protein
MDEETMKALQILRQVNEALIDALGGAILCMENWNSFTPEEKQASIEKLKALVAQSGRYYGPKKPEH